MKKIYYLKTCDTCKRILKSIPLDGFILQDIKSNPIKLKEIEQMKELAGNYESLFSRRAKKYKAMDLKNQTLSEIDYKQLILNEYTFLKRPVILINGWIFIGNSEKNVSLLSQMLNS